MMLKRYLSIFFLSFACSIILGHSSVPHFHDFEEHSTINQHGLHEHQHHATDDAHEQKENTKEKGIGHLLAHVTHTTGEITFLKSHSCSDSSSNQSIPLLLFTTFFSITFDDFAYLRNQKPKIVRNIFYDSHHCLSSGLRAPPSSIV